MRKTLRPYQKENIKDIFSEFKKGNKKVIYQLPTGGGKTLTASELIHFFVENNKPFEALFFVHRVELLDQFKKSFQGQFKDYEVGVIDRYSKMKRFDLNVNVSMIETAKRRLKKDSNFFGKNVRLLIIDEAHNSNFDDIMDFFPNALVIGLTATPTRQSKKNPLNLHYDSIVCGPKIQELIAQNSLLPNKTYVIDTGVDYSKIKKTAGDYNANAIYDEYKNEKYVRNVVKAYLDKCEGKKTIIFNSNVAHSLLVNDAFLRAGFNSKHLDGSMKKEDRKAVLKWFEITPNAILNNVGVLTAGFDESTICNVIMNRPTTSLALWLQCTGRGSRLSFGKDYFNIIDLGGNAERLGDWSHPHDWADIFYNAKYKVGGEGEAPIKICPECACALHISVMECPECGFEFVKKTEEEQEDEQEVKLKLLTDNFAKKVNIHKINNFVKKMQWNEYAGVHQIKDIFLRTVKNKNLNPESNEYDKLYNAYINEVESWCKINGKKFDKFHQNFANEIINKC